MLSMKQLIAGIVILIVVGVGAFLYRNMMEQPGVEEVACTMEAKVCPDGSSVGRQGPNCEFAACPAPNIEIPESGIVLVPPAGYTQVMSGAPSQDTLRIFSKATMSPSVQHSITVYHYPIPAGGNADDVILANTRYQPADMQAEDFERFETVVLGGKTFRMTVIERFEGIVQSAYFFVRGNEVVRFDILEHDVTGWMEPELEVRDLPQHQAIETMLESAQIAP